MLWLFVTIFTFSDATITPKVAIVPQGEHPEFTCFNDGSATQYFQIQVKLIGHTDPNIIFDQSFEGVDPSYENDYTVSKNFSSGYYNFTIMNVSSVHAGTYICDWGNGQAKAELVVLANSRLMCLQEVNIEPDVRLECSVYFAGNVIPIPEFWRVTDDGRKHGPIGGRSERNGNTSKTVLELYGHLSKSCYGYHVCQLSNVTSRKGNIQWNCSFETNSIPGSDIEPRDDIGIRLGIGVTVASTFVFAFIALLLGKYNLLYKRRLSQLSIEFSNNTDLCLIQKEVSCRH